jgi:hypothetical protein
MDMDMRPRRSPRARWIVLAWLLTMTSGALAASLVRLPTSIPGNRSLWFLAHGVIAVAIGSAVIGHLVRAHANRRLAPALFVAATFVCGLFVIRSFEPLTSAAHAALAAYAALALASTGTGGLSGGGPGGRSWQAPVAGAGVLLVILQIALGALVRHHLIGYGLHLLVAGLIALAILVPAVAVSQDEGATAVLKRIAMLAIASLLVQLSLGVVVLFMILTGSANVNAWLFTTVAHVVAGTITLLAAASLAHALRAGEPANREPANPRVFRTAR